MVLFFTHFLLGEKSELAKVWLAAHWEKKIKKSQIFEINIEHSIQSILSNEIVLDLRLSGHLLVGIVRIHSRKAKYLLSECSDVFFRVRTYQYPLIDLPESKREASVKAITLPELFGNVDYDFSKMDELLSLNQCHTEEITLKETQNMHTLDDDLNFDFRDEDQPINLEDIEYFSHLNDDQNPEHADKCNNLMHSSVIEKGENICENECTSSFDSEINMNHFEKKQNSGSMALIIDTIKNPSHSLQEKKLKLNLEPLKVTISKIQADQKRKSKRKLIVDQVKTLPHEQFLQQLYDTSDIITTLNLGPPSKIFMKLKAIGSADQLLCLPGQGIGSSKIKYLFQRHLKTQREDEKCHSSEDEEACNESNEQLQLTSNKKLPAKVDNVIRRSSQSHSVPIIFSSKNRKSSVLCSGLLDEDNTSELVDMDYGDNGKDLEELMDTKIFHLLNDSHFPVEAAETQERLQDFSDDFELNTPRSETEDDKWEIILQGRMIITLRELYKMFETSSKLYFSHLVQHKKRTMVYKIQLIIEGVSGL
ncbi:double-strand-break repair protein rad21 homolog isoform X2 [Stegodyphus dumicola]|uniref:double-strand-break repair protein rad21 homolog isoform X2 n=1 Tax=Stegodyphus dumicola TaxID=202533 RepID=UPI0015AAC370|nr:double-strand-break repair protein rad21 homolog isoform X2 [Stegodyphus dumicola]